IGGQIDGPDGLFYSDKEKLESLGAQVNMETKVKDVDFEGKTITVQQKDGSEIQESYDKLILASGSWPIIPKIPGVGLKNVQLVKLYQHAADVIEKIKSPDIKNITIVGAGYIGVELAEAFQRNGKNTTLIDVAETCLSSYYDEDFRNLMRKNLEDHGINVVFGEKLTEIRGTEQVEEVVTEKNTYKADMVVLCIGFAPNTELGGGKIERYKNGAYLVNKKQETSVKDVYAIGDCCTVYDNSIEAPDYIALATNAVRSGIVAAHNVCGTGLESAGVQGSNGICIYDLKMVSSGLTMDNTKNLGIDALATDYEDLQKPEFIRSNNPSVKLRIVYDAKTRVILGAQMASTYDMTMG
ncbi:MAG: FAD-dependent oxidoreductase, partial [Eubacteriales bacterium]